MVAVDPLNCYLDASNSAGMQNTNIAETGLLTFFVKNRYIPSIGNQFLARINDESNAISTQALEFPACVSGHGNCGRSEC
ncbi:MAG: hypothetical protein AB8B95_06590 [Pseudohongiellaceae bacterium]